MSVEAKQHAVERETQARVRQGDVREGQGRWSRHCYRGGGDRPASKGKSLPTAGLTAGRWPALRPALRPAYYYHYVIRVPY